MKEFYQAAADLVPFDTHLFRYEDQPTLLGFLEDRLGSRIELARENASPPVETRLSDRVAEKYRRKCAAEFALYDAIP